MREPKKRCLPEITAGELSGVNGGYDRNSRLSLPPDLDRLHSLEPVASGRTSGVAIGHLGERVLVSGHYGPIQGISASGPQGAWHRSHPIGQEHPGGFF